MIGMSIEYVPVHVMCEYKQSDANIYTEPPNFEPYCGKKADTVIRLANPEKYEGLDYEEAVNSPLNAYFIGPDGRPEGMVVSEIASFVMCEEHAEEVVSLDEWEYENKLEPEDLRIPSVPKSIAEELENVPVKDEANID